MKTVFNLICTTLIVLSSQALSGASSLFISYSSSSGGGGIEAFSLIPNSKGTLFDSESVPVTSLTVANNVAYWATSNQIFADGFMDTTGGSQKNTLPSIPFSGVTISDLAVDPKTNSYFVGWNAPGYGWFIAQYPLSPQGNYSIFTNNTAVIQGLSIAGDTAYWIEGTKVYSQKLDGTGKTVVQSFTFGGVTLGDLAIDTAGQTYLLSALTTGLPPLVGRYPLTPNASGNLFAFANNTIAGLTVAGNRAYWIDGSSVWSENLNGTDLKLQETLPPQFTLTDLAVSIDPPNSSATVPEPASLLMLGGGLIAAGLMKVRISG